MNKITNAKQTFVEALSLVDSSIEGTDNLCLTEDCDGSYFLLEDQRTVATIDKGSFSRDMLESYNLEALRNEIKTLLGEESVVTKMLLGSIEIMKVLKFGLAWGFNNKNISVWLYKGAEVVEVTIVSPEEDL